MSSAASKLAAIVLLVLTAIIPAFAAELPSEPHTIPEFEEVWDYVAANDANHVEIHYTEKQSSNTYHRYKTLVETMSKQYRYVHPEDFNYMRLKDCSFVDDEGTREGFTMILEFEDLSDNATREMHKTAISKAKEIYDNTVRHLSPELSQTKRAEILCHALNEKAYYKNDKTDLCHTAYSVFTNGYGVCDGLTSALNMLLRLDGIECEGRIGKTGDGLHEWTYAKLDGKWVNIDMTWLDGGNYEYLGMTDEEISKTHTADLTYQTLRNKEHSVTFLAAS